MITNKIMSVALFLLLTSLSNIITANEANTKNKDITVISYGIYAHTPDNGKSWINPISKKVIKGKSSSPVHLSNTRTIPAQYPLFFGFEYNVSNIKDSIAEFTTEVTHPKIKQADGTYSEQYQHTQKFLVIDGKVTATSGYLLENKDEIQTGEWIFKIKIKGKTVITQRFNIKAKTN